ncbi:MAG UNVERIFIED_CONTAM: phage tail tape measure protein, partial [Thermobifida fusca]
MSTRRDLIYRMTADPEGFKRGMREAGQDSRAFYRELKQLEEQQRAVDEVMTGTGVALLGFGAAVGAGLGLAAKAAIDWESAWTGVAKVVDGSPEQLAALEAELRDLATTLPQTHEEIAGVAAAAGQLGIAREDIAQFTEVMVSMGVATNLSSEEASFALARMMNIMQTAPDDVTRLGSSIVGLGNNVAATESEITEMALRIAGAGQTVGMTEADVLSFAAALSAVGIEAESGGSSISVAMVKIAEAVNEGSDSLQVLADVSGVSSKEFADQWRSDPAAAINLFVEGLGRMQRTGGDVFTTLESLGMSEIRLRDSFLRLAGAGDLLRKSLDTGAQAWRENTALTNEGEKRYATTASKIQVAWNSIKDVAIDVGAAIAPLFCLLADGASLVGDAFNLIPGPLKSALGLLGGFAGVAAVAGGAFLLFAPRIVETSRALRELDIRGRLASGRLGSLTRGALKVSGAFAALSVIGS